MARAASLRSFGLRFAAVALLPFVPSLVCGRHLVGEGLLFGRRNAAPIEVTNSDRDADDK